MKGCALMQKQKMDFIKTKEFWIALGGIILFSVLWLGSIPIHHSRSNKKSEDFIKKLSSSYSDNAAACIDKYDGKEVSFECKVAEIPSSLDYIVVVSVKDELMISTRVVCNLHSEELQNKALKLKKGDKIKVKGSLIVSTETGRAFGLNTESISKL